MDRTNGEEILRAAAELLRPHLERSEPLRNLAAALGQWLIAQGIQATPAASEGPPENTPAVVLNRDTHPAMEDDCSELAFPPEAGSRLNSNRELELKPVLPVDNDHLPELEARSTGLGSMLPFEFRMGGGLPEAGVSAVRAEDRGWTAIRGESPMDAASSGSLLDVGILKAVAESCRKKSAARLHGLDDPYEALAESSALVARLLRCSGSEMQLLEAVQLLIESSSAFRVALERLENGAKDPDQLRVNDWLKQGRWNRRLFGDSYSQLMGQCHDPSGACRVINRCRELQAWTPEADPDKLIQEALKKLKWHKKRLEQRVGCEPTEELDDILKIAKGIDAALSAGFKISNLTIKEILGPALLHRVFDLPDLSTRVSKAIEEWIPCDEREGEPDDDLAAYVVSQDIIRVRDLVRGRGVVVIGGDEKLEYMEQWHEAFGWDLEWVKLKEHGSPEPMEAPIADPNTCLVLIFKRWVGHHYFRNAKDLGKERGKAVVIIPRGYNANAIAHHILDQASGKLQRGCA